VILSATSPTAAFKAGEKTGDPLQMYMSDVFTVTCNIAGIAGVSIPCGFTAGATPLPIGLQLLAPALGEQTMLRAARMYESATDWNARRPNIV
jgi:aspartyl-tRNA(Asn)/glutamyl-tRNA(Gln) amidotransferase subunit A